MDAPFEAICLEPVTIVVLDEEELWLDPDAIIMLDCEDDDPPDETMWAWPEELLLVITVAPLELATIFALFVELSVADETACFSLYAVPLSLTTILPSTME
jgi:hypothetical protein